jgi:CubicO group peptidase (beta-lactamase class C family)
LSYQTRLTIAFLFICQALFTGFHLQAAADQASGRYKEAIAQYETFVKKRMKTDRLVGLTVGFMKDDFSWTKGFGYADLENKTAMSAAGSFRMASITKTFTSVALLQLVEQGKINLDAEVQTYVPGFPRKKWPVPVRLVLGHLGGISHYKNYDEEGHIKIHKNTKDALAIFQDFALVAEPGARYHYSSYGFNLLGAVIEGASGQSYGEYLKEHIFKPLGMEHTRMDDPVALIPNRVRGYRRLDNKLKNSEYVDMSSRFAGGGTRSTALDLLKFARGMMRCKLLKKETMDLMWTSQATRGGRFTGYGMGWSVRPWYGYFRTGHSGSQQETRTYLLILPDLDFALSVCCNTEGADLAPYVNKLAELITGADTGADAVFTGDKQMKPVLTAIRHTFLYGLSYYLHRGAPLAENPDPGTLKKAFDFFNRHVNKKALKRDFKGVGKKILTGAHPASGRAFTKIGSHMAAALAKAHGKEKLEVYTSKGPLAFFHDYLALPDKGAAGTGFTKKMKGLISRWHRDWNRVYTDMVKNLEITPDSDFKAIGPQLKPLFAKASVYPDINGPLLAASFSLMRADKPDQCAAARCSNGPTAATRTILP